MANLRLLYYFLWRRASRDFIEGPIDFLSKWNWRSCNKKLMRGGGAKKSGKIFAAFFIRIFFSYLRLFAAASAKASAPNIAAKAAGSGTSVYIIHNPSSSILNMAEYSLKSSE